MAFAFCVVVLSQTHVFSEAEAVSRISPVWAKHFGAEDQTPESDLDLDGHDALTESAFGTDPNDGASTPSPRWTDAGDGSLLFEWRGLSGLSYVVQRSENLVDWVPVGDAVRGVGDRLQAAVHRNATSVFYRLAVLPPGDSDGDLLSDYEESLLGTDIFLVDSDEDGRSDSEEWAQGTDPTMADSESLPVLGVTPYLAAASQRALALKSDGRLWAVLPELDLVHADADWRAVGLGLEQGIALKSDGSLWQWAADSASPIRLSQITGNWQAVSEGWTHTLAISSNGSLFAWGRSSFGKLGDGQTSEDRPSPVSIGTESDWVQVAAGDND